MIHGPRMRPRCAQTNAVDGTVVWSPVKSIWYTLMLICAVLAGPPTFSWSAATVSGCLTVLTLCVGHSVGMHRLLIHRSFRCPVWMERLMVSMGVLVGMGGPQKMLYMHDIRDWAQRQSECHTFFIHQSAIWKDWFRNLHCELKLHHPPEFVPGERVTQCRLYQWLDRYWLMTQLPLAVLLYITGGIDFVIWGVCVRVALSLTGHWFVGYLAHNVGDRDWHVTGAAVQGYNLSGLGMLTMGEAWHNNHHAFPESAKFGLKKGQNDPGWWLLTVLHRCGLAYDIKLPHDLPSRAELRRINDQRIGTVPADTPRHLKIHSRSTPAV